MIAGANNGKKIYMYMISGINETTIDNVNGVSIMYMNYLTYELLKITVGKLRNKVHKHDPPKFPNIFLVVRRTSTAL